MKDESLDSCVFFDAHYFKAGDDPDVYFRGRQPQLPKREAISRKKPKNKEEEKENNVAENIIPGININIEENKEEEVKEEEKEIEVDEVHQETKVSALNQYGQEIPIRKGPKKRC